VLLEKQDRPKPMQMPSLSFHLLQEIMFIKRGDLTSKILFTGGCARRMRTALGKPARCLRALQFLLMDLGDDPIVVTGSANFSEASTNDNDENMLHICGNRV